MSETTADLIKKANSELSTSALIQAAQREIKPQQPVTDRHGGSSGGPGDFIGGVAQIADVLTAAPTRAGLRAGIQGFKDAPENLPLINKIGSAAKASVAPALDQFLSMNPKQAPTGGEIARQDLNIPTSTEGSQPRTLPNPADLAGFGIDVLADVGNVIPVRMAPRVAGQVAQKVTGKTPELFKKAPSEIADFLTGSKLPSRTAKAVKAGSDEFRGTLQKTFTSTPQPDFIRFEQTMIRNGIKPDNVPASIRFGKNSAKNRQEQFLREGKDGEKLFQDFERKSAEINNAIRNDIKRVGKGDPLPNYQAGQLIRENFDETVNKLFDDITVSYDNAVPPGAFIEDEAFTRLDATLGAMKKRALRDAEKGASNEVVSQGEQLLRNIDNIEKGNGSYKETLDSMRDIGKAAFRSQNPATVSPDVKEMQKLYFSLRDALTETARFHNPTVADQLIDNNVLITELLGDKNTLAKVVQNKNLSDEQVFNNIILNGNSKSINALNTFFGGDDLQKLKGAFLESVIRENAITGNIGAASTANLLKRKGHITDFLFNEGELQNFKDLLELSDGIGSPVLSNSGTGGTLQQLKTAPSRGLESFLESFSTPIARQRESTILPAITSPKAFLQGKGSKAKAAQVFSTQQEDRKREAVERAVVIP